MLPERLRRFNAGRAQNSVGSSVLRCACMPAVVCMRRARAETGGGLEDAGAVLGLTPELVEGLGVVEALVGLVEVVDDLLGGGLLAQELLGLVVLAPKRRVGGLGVELFEAL